RSVLALHRLVGLQVASGLVANDEIALQGPLDRLQDSDAGRWLTGLHREAKWWLLGLIGLHVLAIAYYSLIRKRPLVRAMITGRSQRTSAEQHDAQGGAPWLAAVTLVCAVLAVWTVDSVAGWLAPPPPKTAPVMLDW